MSLKTQTQDLGFAVEYVNMQYVSGSRPFRLEMLAFIFLLPLFSACGLKIKGVALSSGLASFAPTLTLSDSSSNLASYSRQLPVAVVIAGDSGAVSWCLSESQSTAPATSSATCVGGQGTQSGWHTSSPTTFALSSGDAAKTVYLWLADASGSILNSTAVLASITLDTQVPTPTFANSHTSPTNSTSITVSGACTDPAGVPSTNAVKICAKAGSVCAAYPSSDYTIQADCIAGSYTKAVTVSQATYDIEVVLVDAVGNASSAAGSGGASFLVDTTAPALASFTTPTQDSYVLTGNAVNYIWSAPADTGGSGLATSNLYLVEQFANSDCSGAPSASASQMATNFGFTPGTAGANAILVTTYDAVGNASRSCSPVYMSYTNVKVWTGLGGDTNWGNGNNWSGNVKPGVDDLARFDNTCLPNCTVVQNLSENIGGMYLDSTFGGTITRLNGNGLDVKSLSIHGGTFNADSGGAIFQVSGNFTLTGGSFTSNAAQPFFRNGSITITGGTYNPQANSNATMRCDSAGKVRLTATVPMSFANLSIWGCDLTVTGTVTVALSTAIQIWNGNTPNVSGGTFQVQTAFVNISAGTVSSNIEVTGTNSPTVGGSATRFTGDLIINKTAGALTLFTDIPLAGNLTITQGSLDLNGRNLSFAGPQWTLAAGATLIPSLGSVIFTGTNQTITGSNTFYNFTKNVTSASTLTLAAGSTQTVTNNLDLKGVSGSRLSLRSATPGTAFNLAPSGTVSVDYLDVKDSSTAPAINASGTNSIDSGGNTGWSF